MITDENRKKDSDIEPCPVTKESFPCIGKCCRICGDSKAGGLEKICGYCTVWMSRPEGESLQISEIIECGLYGYGKRIRK